MSSRNDWERYGAMIEALSSTKKNGVSNTDLAEKMCHSKSHCPSGLRGSKRGTVSSEKESRKGHVVVPQDRHRLHHHDPPAPRNESSEKKRRPKSLREYLEENSADQSQLSTANESSFRYDQTSMMAPNEETKSNRRNSRAQPSNQRAVKRETDLQATLKPAKMKHSLISRQQSIQRKQTGAKTHIAEQNVGGHSKRATPNDTSTESISTPAAEPHAFSAKEWVVDTSASVECELSPTEPPLTQDDTVSSPLATGQSLGRSKKADSKPKANAPSRDSDQSKEPTITLKMQHLSFFGHGRFWTIAALVMSLLGTIFAMLSRRSTAFVHVSEPIEIAPIYNPVYETGMLRLQICYNETVGAGEGCKILRLSTDDIDDNMFNLARLLLTLGTILGCFFSIFLASAVFWESINLRPIGFGYMVTYFVQSFSMLFFDTDLCTENKCSMGPGCVYCVLACLGWIGACIATAKMDAHKVRELRRRRRRERKRLKELKRINAMTRENSNATEETDTGSNSSQEIDLEIGPEGRTLQTTHCQC